MRALFGNPGAAVWLLAPLGAAVLLWIFARTRNKIARAFVGAALHSRMLVAVDPARRRTKALLLLLALLALATAMMKPHWGTVYERVERKGIDVVFLVDVSKSMLADDVKPNRLGRVVLEIKRFIETAPINDRVALVCFAGQSHVQCPLTHDFSAFRLFLDDVDPKLIPRGGTDLEDALYRAMQAFPDEERNHKAIVLFTDGEEHDGDVDRAAAEAAKRNIRIFTVGIGSPEGALIPIVDERGNRTYLKDKDGQVVKSRLDEVVLQKIALATSGAYKRMVGGEDALAAIYGEASKIETKTLESRQEKRAVDRFQWFVAAGLVLLAFEALLAESRRRRSREEPAEAGGPRAARAGGPGVLVTLCLVACLAAPAIAQTSAALKKAAEGRDLLSSGHADEALARFKDAQIEMPDAPELALDVGLALFKLGRFDEAASAFSAAAAAKDVKLEALARFHLGNALFRQGNLDGALVSLNTSLRLVPDDEDAKFNREVVVRHIKERERQKKDEEKKNEVEKLLREVLKREVAVTRATRAVRWAAGEQPTPMESVVEIAADLDVAAESRPESRPSPEDVARAATQLAGAQDAVAQLTAELVDKIAKEAESRPATPPPGPGGGGAPGADGPDPEKLKKVGALVTEAGAAMKEAATALRAPDLGAAEPHEEKALRKLLDALNEFLDELTRIIIEQGKTVTATSAVAHDAGLELELPDSRPAESRPSKPKRASTRPSPVVDQGVPGERAAHAGGGDVVDPARVAPLAAKEKDLQKRTDAFATGVEGMLQQMKGAETRGAADSRAAQKGPKPKDVEEALTLLHKASGHLGTAAGELGPPRLQPAFDAEVLALKELIEAKKLSPPEQQQQKEQQKQDDQQKDQKKDDQKKDDEKDKDQKPGDQDQKKDEKKDEKKKEDKKLSPEEAEAILDRLRAQEKDWRDKKNAERKPAKGSGVTKDW